MMHRLLSIFLLAAIVHTAPAQDNPKGGFGAQGFGLGNIVADAQQDEETFGDSRDQLDLEFNLSQSVAAPGATIGLAVTFKLNDGWHIWPQEGGAPEGTAIFDGAVWTEIFATEDNGISLASIQWPATHTVSADIGEGPQKYAVFEGEATAFLTLHVAEDPPSDTATLTLAVSFQACDATTCMAPTFDPPTASFEIRIDPAAIEVPAETGVFAGWNSEAAPAPTTEPTTTVANTSPSFFGLTLPETGGFLGIVVLLLLGVLGGFVLNLTPCVLPIIPIKIMTLSQHAASPGHALRLGIWMALGVFSFWFAIGVPAALVTSLADPSRVFGIWWVTVGIGALIGVMGVGIMGLFTLSLPQSVYLINPKADTAWGSFLFGVMTAVLGLPCFGFVAGALLAATAKLPPIVTVLIFSSMGIGMAAPYLLLAARPSLLKRIPQTGPASDLVKQVMGGLLLAAATFFIGSGLIGLVAEQPWLARQLHWWIVAIAATATAGWLCMRTFQITQRVGQRVTWTIVAIVLAGVPLWYAQQSTAKAHETWLELATIHGEDSIGFSTKAWNPYTPARLQAARDAGKTVVVNFTAEWCLTCKQLKAAVLDPEPIRSRFADDDSIVTFTADNTARNAPGWALMESIGQRGIPALAIWGPDTPDQSPWLSGAYTSQHIIDALKATN